MLEEYQARVEALAEEQLAPYVAWLGDQYQGRHASAKEINDPVWGTLTLSGLEILILDSPPLQRLRRIRQLGVAHWVYPAANHTRLEHSIGALFLVQRLLLAASAQGHVIPEPYQKGIRVATLCHDVGHGVMSHVSENALAYVPEVEQLRLEFTKAHGREAQIGEMNTFFLVGAPAFGELLRAAEHLAGETLGLPDPLTFLQNCVIAKPLDPEYPILHQLVSGPFDADKLDYMTRDAFMSGVPVVADVNRLIQKVRTVRIPRVDAPISIQRLSNVDTAMVVVTGVERSGNRTLDELTLGRTLLFDKLYRHHKTRAFESMISAIIVRLARRAVAEELPVEAALLAFRMDDDNLAVGHFENALVGYELDDESRQVVAHLTETVRNRRPFVRAIAFSRKITGDPYCQDDEQARGLQELLAYIDDPVRRRETADAIADLTATAVDVLGLTQVVAGWPGSLRDYIWLDGVRNAEHLAASTKAMLITQDGGVIPFAAEAPETPQWASAYQQTRDTAFVFCPPEIAVATALASERFLREEFGVRLPPGSLVARRRSPSSLRDERSALATKGYYDTCSSDLLPLPDRLFEGDSDSYVSALVGRLQGYCPPLVAPDRAGRDRFEPGVVRDFMQQFTDNPLIDTALKVISKCEIIDRHAVVQPLLAVLQSEAGLHDASLVVFGTAGDSSSIATYFSLDAGVKYPRLKVRDLGEALVNGKPIIFADDIIGSGRQAASIVNAWFGDHALADELGETRRELPPDVRDLLRATRTTFVFAVGLDGGEDELRTALTAQGFQNYDIRIGRTEATLPTVFSSGEVTDADREAFVAFCSSAGDDLLADQDLAKRESRRLGYGNKGLLITFPYNTPSQTMTCIWERGTVNGRAWTPLFPRRRKR